MSCETQITIVIACDYPLCTARFHVPVEGQTRARRTARRKATEVMGWWSGTVPSEPTLDFCPDHRDVGRSAYEKRMLARAR